MGCHLPETDGQAIRRQDGTPVVGVHPTNPSTNPSQQVVKLGTGKPQVAMEMANSPALYQLWRSYKGNLTTSGSG